MLKRALNLLFVSDLNLFVSQALLTGFEKNITTGLGCYLFGMDLHAYRRTTVLYII